MKSLRKQLGRYKFVVTILIVIIFILIVVVARQSNKENPLASTAVATVAKQDVEKIVSASGHILPQDSRDVYLPQQAKVKQVYVKVGDSVVQDQSLGVIEISTGTLTRELDVASPIAGMVSEVNVKLNDTILNYTQVAFKVINQDSYYIELLINENDITDLQVGQAASIVVPALSLDDTYVGEVTSVAPDAYEGQSTVVAYKVDVHMTDLPTGFKPGMSAEVEITVDSVQAVLAIPESFLIERDDSYWVKQITWLDDQKTTYEISEVEVEIGLRTNAYVEIKSGVKEGSELVEPAFTEERMFSFFGG